MKTFARRVWQHFNPADQTHNDLLTLDEKIKVHVYDVSPHALSDLIKAGLECLKQLDSDEEHKLSLEASRALKGWGAYLPQNRRRHPFSPDQADASLSVVTTPPSPTLDGADRKEVPV